MASRRDVSESTSKSTRLLGRGRAIVLLPSHRGGLRVGAINEEHSSLPSGTVISQSPGPMAKLDRGGSITLVVSAGP